MGEIKYRSESEMKDSGIEWLGEIAEDFYIKSLKHSYKFTTGSTPSSGDESYYSEDGYKWLTISDMNSKYIKNTSSYISIKAIRETNIKLNKKGSLVYSFKLSVGKVAFLKDDMYTNEAIATFDISNKNNLNFLYYMAPIFIIKNANENIYGAKLLNQNLIKNANILIPEINCQQKIANFLDVKTAEFDSIISKKELLIEKLEEAKKSLISEVVTGKVKIVDEKLIPRDDIEMKDSGVEWLGKVPKHWSLKPLNTLFIQNKKKNIQGIEDNVLSLSYGNIIRRDVESNFGLLPASFNNYQVVSKGYLIFRLTDLQNDKRSLRVGLVKEKGIITSAYIGLKSEANISSLFMYYLFHTYDLHKVYYNMGGGLRQSMTYEDMKKMSILFPDINKQKELSEFISSKARDIDMTIIKTKEILSKLTQAKQSLISEAVTGKIDLRDWEIVEEGEVE